MALLDQLFRLRGAPRAGKPPVTLGALVAALPPAPIVQSQCPEAGPGAGEVEPTPEPPIAEAPPLSTAPAAPTAGPAESAVQSGGAEMPSQPARPMVRSGFRFNPFATTEAPASPRGESIPTSPPGLGPCLEDPSLPPLQLQAQVPADRDDRPVILGGAPVSVESGASTELRQIEAPTVRLAPLKVPARESEISTAQAGRPLTLRLEIQAEAFLDVVAFKQHAAKFPGVVKCVISDAHD